jgi:acetoacetyl-CoA reductase
MTQRIAYVTGGMGGIGTSICQRLHKEGYKVVAGCGPNSPRRVKWLEEQKALGYDFIASEGNVGDWESTKAAFDKVKAEVGEVDILVNNAGITRDVVFRKMTHEDWTAVIDTNLTSLFNVTKQVIDGMVERGFGRVINISSVNGQKGQFGQTNYSTAKAGIHGFTMSLAQEVATKGVTIWSSRSARTCWKRLSRRFRCAVSVSRMKSARSWHGSPRTNRVSPRALIFR